MTTGNAKGRRHRSRFRIDRLPEKVRRDLRKWLLNPGLTQVEVTALLNARLLELGRPERFHRRAVSRYDKKLRGGVEADRDLESLRGMAEAAAKLSLEAQRLRETAQTILEYLAEGEDRR